MGKKKKKEKQVKEEEGIWKKKGVKEEKAQRKQKRKKRCGKGEEELESGGGHCGSVRVKELIERVMTSEAF